MIDKKQISDEAIEQVAKFFSLLGEPTRIRIMRSLCDGEKCVADVVTESGSTQSNISRHLSLMHQAGMLVRKKAGNQIFYAIADPVFIELCQMVCMRVVGRNNAAQDANAV